MGGRRDNTWFVPANEIYLKTSGEKIYHMPGGAYYDRTILEAWFKTESEAKAAGYRPSSRKCMICKIS